jgi:hypothetical protein
MSVDYIGTGNDDGVDFGQASTTKIGFFGLTTPIVRAVLTLAGSATATIPADITYIKTFLINLGLAASA